MGRNVSFTPSLTTRSYNLKDKVSDLLGLVCHHSGKLKLSNLELYTFNHEVNQILKSKFSYYNQLQGR